MAVKEVDIPGIGPVTLQKRRGNRSLRISITPAGKVRVSLPVWAAYRQAIDFAASRRAWVIKHRPIVQPIEHATRVGKAHQLTFITKPEISRPHTRVRGNEIIVSVPSGQTFNDPHVQKLASQAAIKALKAEASALLPSRLDFLAKQHGFTYSEVSIKRLSSRWGSCDQRTNISLNCYLMQLPWHLIDYVLLHELTHTRVMAHGPRFWTELGVYVPDLAAIRKEIRARRPSLVL